MAAERPKSNPSAKVCGYCGDQPALTVDHVIPKSLFPRPLSKFMLTVPACKKCNEEKALDDDYLRDMMVIDIENDGHTASAVR